MRREKIMKENEKGKNEEREMLKECEKRENNKRVKLTSKKVFFFFF